MCMCMCIFTVVLHKTYEFVSFVRDKMKQTELGEVIGTLHQERGEEREGVGEEKGYAMCLTNDHRCRAPLGGISRYCTCACSVGLKSLANPFGVLLIGRQGHFH